MEYKYWMSIPIIRYSMEVRKFTFFVNANENSWILQSWNKFGSLANIKSYQLLSLHCSYAQQTMSHRVKDTSVVENLSITKHI